MAYFIMFLFAAFFCFCVGGPAGIIVCCVFAAYFFYCFALNGGNAPRFSLGKKRPTYEPPWITDGHMNEREFHYQWRDFSKALPEKAEKWVEMTIEELEKERDENKAVVDLYESQEGYFPEKPYYVQYHIAHWHMDALNFHIQQRKEYEEELRLKEEKRKRKRKKR